MVRVARPTQADHYQIVYVSHIDGAVHLISFDPKADTNVHSTRQPMGLVARVLHPLPRASEFTRSPSWLLDTQWGETSPRSLLQLDRPLPGAGMEARRCLRQPACPLDRLLDRPFMRAGLLMIHFRSPSRLAPQRGETRRCHRPFVWTLDRPLIRPLDRPLPGAGWMRIHFHSHSRQLARKSGEQNYSYGRRRLKRYAEPVLNNGLCNSVKAAGRMTNDLFSGILKAGFKKCEVVLSWWSSFVFTGSCAVPRQR
jgi:hypothetical protein